MEDYYKLKTYDFKIIKGDTLNMPFKIYDSDGEPINITNWGAKFNVYNNAGAEVITALYKYHNDNLKYGKGIYFNNDNQKPVGLDITEDHQLVVILDYEDTNLLNAGVYPYDLEFTVTINNDFSKITIKGNLIVESEVTISGL